MLVMFVIIGIGFFLVLFFDGLIGCVCLVYIGKLFVFVIVVSVG